MKTTGEAKDTAQSSQSGQTSEVQNSMNTSKKLAIAALSAGLTLAATGAALSATSAIMRGCAWLR